VRNREPNSKASNAREYNSMECTDWMRGCVRPERKHGNEANAANEANGANGANEANEANEDDPSSDAIVEYLRIKLSTIE
jgi:hypothetical protein